MSIFNQLRKFASKVDRMFTKEEQVQTLETAVNSAKRRVKVLFVDLGSKIFSTKFSDISVITEGIGEEKITTTINGALVDVSSEMVAIKLNSKREISLMENKIAINFKTLDIFCLVGDVWECITNKGVSFSQNYLIFKPAVPTQSGSKDVECLFVRDSYDLEEAYNKASCGGYNEVIKSKMSLKEKAKAMTRLQMLSTGMVRTVKVDPTVTEDTVGIGKFKGLADGTAFARQSVYFKLFSFFTGKIAENFVNHIFQARVGFSKEAILFLTDKQYAETAESCGASDDKEIIIDGNAAKAPWNYDKSYIDIITVARDFKVNTSVQMLLKLLYFVSRSHNFEGSDSIFNDFIEAAKPLAKGFVASMEEFPVTKGGCSNTKDFSFLEKAFKEATGKEFHEVSLTAKSSKVSQWKNKVSTEAFKLKIRIDGVTLTIMPSVAEIVRGKNYFSYNQGICQHGFDILDKKASLEALIIGNPDNLEAQYELQELIERYVFEETTLLSGETVEGVVSYLIKYPSVNGSETHKLVLLPKYAMEYALQEAAPVWGSFYKELPKAGVIVPAYKRLMSKLAGFDFDFDSISVITDKRIVEPINNHYREVTIDLGE